MAAILATIFLVQQVRVGKTEIPVSVRAKNGERGPSATDFGAVERERGILVAFARPRHIHFYSWTRKNPGRRLYDVAFLAADGQISEVVPLVAEEMTHSDPSFGINKIRGVTSTSEAVFALFLAANSAARLGVKKGTRAEVDLAGAAPEELPAIESDGRQIFLEIVGGEPDRSRGLTYRPAISKGDGMLFAFADARKRPFWMYHTYMSIDVCYLGDDGTLLEINPMKKLRDPDDEGAARQSMVPTKVEARYVLETAFGYMKEAGFKVGDKFVLPKELTELKPEKSPFEK
jgi:uncharacterized membrane protein (UPF0127 family)